jgi:hypothetical protein
VDEGTPVPPRLGLRLAAAAALSALTLGAVAVPSVLAGPSEAAPAAVASAGAADADTHADGSEHEHLADPATKRAGDPTPDHVDPAPPGVDVADRPSTAELLARLRAEERRKLERAGLTGAEADAVRADRVAAAEATGEPTAAAAGTVPDGTSALPGLTLHADRSCQGTGTDGNRVQAMYVVEADKPDRYASLLSVLRNEIANVDDTFALSSAKTGGNLRVRWVFDPATCEPVVQKVVVPAGSMVDFKTSIAAVQRTGSFTDPKRKYLMFADATVLCGIGHLYDDTDPVDNYNDGLRPMFSRVDSGCWYATSSQGSVAAHELMHNIGGVSSRAPNHSPYGHCTDDYDLMCYVDGPGVTMSKVCARAQEVLFDCNNDDYFSTAPVAGSYLATYWNTAQSSFLDTVPPPAGSGPDPAQPPPASTTQPAPSEPAPPVQPVPPAPDQPTVTVSGPASVRPGLPAELTATPSGSGTLTWSVQPADCVQGPTSGATLLLQCSTGRSGAVRATVTYTRLDGLAAQATHEVALTGSAATFTQTLAAAQRSLHPGQSTTLTAGVRYGSTPLLARVAVWSSTDRRVWRPLAGPVDTATSGALRVTVKPARTTYYRFSTAVPAGSGWSAAPAPTATVTVTRWPVRATVSGTSGRPDRVSGRLLNLRTGKAMAAKVVRLQYRTAGTKTWRTVRAYRTSSTGTVSARVQPRRHTYYRWVYAGTSTYLPRTSASVSFRY